MKLRTFLLLIVLAMAVLAWFVLRGKPQFLSQEVPSASLRTSAPPLIPSSTTVVSPPVASSATAVSSPVASSIPVLSPPTAQQADLRRLRQMMAQLGEDEPPRRTLAIPRTPHRKSKKIKTAAGSIATPKKSDERAQKRKKRKRLPMGVILWDHVPVYGAAKGGEKIYEVQTGDFVRVYNSTTTTRYHVYPGLDIYLAATTREIGVAGERLPDKDGWVDRSNLQVFSSEFAHEFLSSLDPVTVGSDPNFSTLAFYERAMKNPDPVVHRVIGPRLIAVVALHEDYGTSWPKLYRDYDPKIRDAALASLRLRGVGNSRETIDDLVNRLIDLTQIPARGEREAEVLAILDILRESHHPRVPIALASLEETWKKTQGDRINESLALILKGK